MLQKTLFIKITPILTEKLDKLLTSIAGMALRHPGSWLGWLRVALRGSSLQSCSIYARICRRRGDCTSYFTWEQQTRPPGPQDTDKGRVHKGSKAGVDRTQVRVATDAACLWRLSCHTGIINHSCTSLWGTSGAWKVITLGTPASSCFI